MLSFQQKFSQISLVVAIGFALVGFHNARAASPDPVAIIRKKDAELQKMLRDKEQVKKTDKLKVLINGIFDFEEMGRHALGPNTWKTMTPTQQTRFVKAFKSIVENTSVKKLEAYKSDSSNYDAPEISEDKASVTSHVFNNGTESIVTYKLQASGEGWKAWDLIIDDLSTARNYGGQFQKILQSSNMEGLIKKLEKRSGDDAPESKKAVDVKKAAEVKKVVEVKKAPVKH